MKEAKARNPDIKLYGLPWAFAGWLDPAAGPDTPAKNAFANPNVSANYTVRACPNVIVVHTPPHVPTQHWRVSRVSP